MNEINKITCRDAYLYPFYLKDNLEDLSIFNRLADFYQKYV